MALDKIIDSTKLDAALTATAEAIRSKTGSGDQIPWDESTGFKTAVESMEVGGSSSEWETVMPETAITFDDGGEYVSFETVYPLTTGKRYKVKWGDTEYESTAVDTVFDGMPCVAIGNVGALAGDPSTEPFVIGYIPAANGFGIIRIDGLDEPVNVAIYKEKAAVVEGAHTITFMSEDGSAVLGTKQVMHGDTCGDPVALGLFATPTKESTAQYDYSFYGWATDPNGAADSNALKSITGDKTLYANFASAVRYYTVNYYDGDTLLKTEQLAYGATPSYEPEKAGYLFGGWSPALTSVTGNADYYSQWVSNAIAAGTCGDNATWALSNSGTLTISGTGATVNCTNSGQSPWNEYKNDITSVVVKEGITELGGYLFYGYTNLKSVTLPNSCTSLGTTGRTFMSCSNLESINIPEGVKTIPTMMLDSCMALTGITIPSSVTTINESAFKCCTSLTAITIPASVTLCDSAFSYCSNITSVIFEDTTTWKTYKWNSSYTSKSTLNGSPTSAQLSDSAEAATLLCSTYQYDKWVKS